MCAFGSIIGNFEYTSIIRKLPRTWLFLIVFVDFKIIRVPLSHSTSMEFIYIIKLTGKINIFVTQKCKRNQT